MMKKVLSVVLAVLMVAVLSVPAFAANPTNTVVGGVEQPMSITFTKQLNTVNFATGYTVIPTLTFDFTVTSGAAQDATATSPEILAGVGTPTVTAAVFTEVGGTTTSQDVVFDFSGIDFAKPGVYRYIVHENQTSETATIKTGVDGAIDFDNNYYALDLYITGEVGNFAISNAIMYKLASATEVPTIVYNETEGKYVYDENGTKKVDTIENTYNFYHLSLKKTISGSMADKTRKFEFYVSITGGPKNTTLKGKIADTDTTFAFDANGTYTGTVELGQNELLEIFSLPKGASYTITENLSASDQNTYKTTITGAGATDGYVASGTMTAKTDVVYDNNYSEITPTGLFLTYGPYALIVVAAVALAVVFLRRRNRNTVDELI